jgi:hypothetical protein
VGAGFQTGAISAASHAGKEKSNRVSVRVIVAVLGGIIFVAAGVAVAANVMSNRQVDFFASGTHQFYVWCAGSKDYIATEQGANAEDAQIKLYNQNKANGHSRCWPVWQARIAE